MTLAILEAWPKIESALRAPGHSHLLKTLGMILDLRAAPLIHVAKITGIAPEGLVEDFQTLERIGLVSGVRQSDPYSAYYTLTPTALELQQFLLPLVK